MNIIFLEAYYSGSHAYFCDGLIKSLSKAMPLANIHKFTLPGQHWRSRLQKSHINLAEQVNSSLKNNEIPRPDVLIVTSLTDGAALRGLLDKEIRNTPLIHYMHENQMSYPLDKESPVFERDQLFAQHIYPAYHLNQALAADKLVFNSQFHRKDFFNGLCRFLKKHGEKNSLKLVQRAMDKSDVIPIGLEFPTMELLPFRERLKKVLWNHRWEYDKNPTEFFQKISYLIEEDPDLQVSLLGEGRLDHQEFSTFRDTYRNNISHYGMLESREDYFTELSQCRLLPVTSHHDFLGLATLEAIIYGVCPLLPNRLVYPELIPQELHSLLLYEQNIDTDDDKYKGSEFHTKASKLLNEGLSREQQQLLSDHLTPYHWDNIARKWEKIFPPKTMSI